MLDNPALFNAVYSTYRVKEHHLPYPGSYLQQPAALIQAWGIVDNALAEVDRTKERIRNARGKPGGRRG